MRSSTDRESSKGRRQVRGHRNKLVEGAVNREELALVTELKIWSVGAGEKTVG